MAQQLPEEWFIEDARLNAAIAWVLTAVLVVAAILNLLAGLFVALAIAAVTAAVAIVPPLVYRSWTRVVPWPLLLVAALPLVVGAYRPSLLGEFVSSISVAVLAMLVVVVLELTTTVRMAPWFAVFFTVMATLATAGFWAVGSALSATYLGTTFLETNDQLMYVFTAALVGGVVAGGLFRLYFRRRLAADREQLQSGEVESA